MKNEQTYSIEKSDEGDAHILFANRGNMMHGMNLCTLSDFDMNGEQTRDKIVKALNSAECPGHAQVPPSPQEEQLRQVLRTLVALKREKDDHGKTDYYLERMPEAWAEAKKLLGE